ncbi:hypothetical protein [Cohnella thailandensis]|uniref:WD40 repeat domain-containing protein n=1 Tax=Cohnella thailandensis TaxID=557557 RepID=A0A841T2L5_9BACL|nr:hypothetical protein [Cohnella thailandensis]MBB6637096.1 hypothetical protein [Cohnella thailandensis]MBP1973013.1 hypothetical protein [Cohnella thailandensis]
MIHRWKKNVPLIAFLLLLPLTGCFGRSGYETIVISGTEFEQEMSEPGSPFQVQTIFRLPETLDSRTEWLGWLNEEDLAGLLPDDGGRAAEEAHRPNLLQRLAPPYDSPVPLVRAADYPPGMLQLSPDGQWLAGLAGKEFTLTAIPNQDVQRVDVNLNPSQEISSRTLRWSANDQYVSFMAAENGSNQAWIMVYDRTKGELQPIPINGNHKIEQPASVVLSDDGNRALIDDGTKVFMAKRNGTDFELQYDHASGATDSVWVDDDRFLFLGQDGTLYQYDDRNRDLSILLEKVGFFSLSPDRKSIAYTQLEKESVFAGKLQGNNILYLKSVYQGVIPEQLIWNRGGGALLIDGSKWYVSSDQTVPMPVPPESGVAQRQTLVVIFR